MKLEITRNTIIESFLTLIAISSSVVVSYLIADTLMLIFALIILFFIIILLNSFLDLKSYKNAEELRNYVEKLLYLIFGDKLYEKYRCHIYFIDSKSNKLVAKEELIWNFSPDAHIEWKVGQGAVGICFDTESETIADLEDTPNVDPSWNIPTEILEKLDPNIKAIFATPLFDKNNKPFCVFSVDTEYTMTYTFKKESLRKSILRLVSFIRDDLIEIYKTDHK